MWFEICAIVAFIALLIYLAKLYIHSNDNYWPSRGVKLIPSKEAATMWELITRKKTFLAMDQGYYNKLKDRKFGGIMEIKSPLLFLTDLDLIKHVLVKDFDHFVDRRDFKLDQDKFITDMLPSLQGQEWKDVRSLLSPAFTTGKIRRMFKHFNNCGKGILQFVKSKPAVGNGKYTIIAQEVVNRFTVDVIGATAFGMETNALKDPDSIFYKMSKRISEVSIWKVVKSFFYLFFPALGKLLKVKLTDADVWDFFTNILTHALKTRESSNEVRDDFLQLMIEARKGELKEDEGDSNLELFEKEAQLKDNKKSKFVLTDDLAKSQSLLFFVAGFDTVASLVTFAAYLLAIHQDIQERLYQEVKTAMEAGNGEIDYDSVGKLEFMDMFLSEIMRAYPPATRLERKCVKDYQLPDSDIKISKNVLVVVPVQGIHHDEKYYPNPEKFDPERFTPQNKATRHPYAYLPFGAGPRNCIGMRFALMESKVAVAYLVYYFLIEPTSKTPIPVKIDDKIGANRPVLDLELQFTLRNQE